MGWTIEISATADKALSKLDPQTARRVLGFLRTRVAALDDPRSIGEALRGPELGAYWKYRVGDYRIIAEIKDAQIVILVLTIGNRREVYRRR